MPICPTCKQTQLENNRLNHNWGTVALLLKETINQFETVIANCDNSMPDTIKKAQATIVKSAMETVLTFMKGLDQ